LRNYTLFLSLRYLWFHKVSTGLGMLGVTVGVALVIVVVGVMDGFQVRIKKSLIGSSSPLVVEVNYDADADRLVDEVRARVPGLKGVSPILETATLIAGERGRSADPRPCIVFGVDAAREAGATDFRGSLKFPIRFSAQDALDQPATETEPFLLSRSRRAVDRMTRPEKQGVILGRELASEMRVWPGDRVRLWALKDLPAGSNGGAGKPTVDSELFWVTGWYDCGYTEIEKALVVMDRKDARSFFRGFPYDVAKLRLGLEDPERADEVKRAVEAHAEEIVRASRKSDRGGKEPLRPRTWMELHSNLLAAVENERGLLLVITSFTFLVVAFLIGSTQSMMVVEKTREIGVLRSLGGSVPGTAGIFLGNGFFIGTLGGAAGWGVGILVTSNLQAIADGIRRFTGRDLFPPNIYRFHEVPVSVGGEFVAMILAGAVAFSLLGALLPALRAAWLHPVESLHHE